MTARETVNEIEARTAVAVDVPPERGGELQTAVEDALSEVSFVRIATVTSVNNVDSGNGVLHVNVEADTTLHFAHPMEEDEAEEALAETDPVATVYHFQTHAGPYEIEQW